MRRKADRAGLLVLRFLCIRSLLHGRKIQLPTVRYPIPATVGNVDSQVFQPVPIASTVQTSAEGDHRFGNSFGLHNAQGSPVQPPEVVHGVSLLPGVLAGRNRGRRGGCFRTEIEQFRVERLPGFELGDFDLKLVGKPVLISRIEILDDAVDTASNEGDGRRSREERAPEARSGFLHCRLGDIQSGGILTELHLSFYERSKKGGPFGRLRASSKSAPTWEEVGVRQTAAGLVRLGTEGGATSVPRKKINFDTVRKIGLALPGVEEGTTYGSPALKVRRKLLTCIPIHRSAERGSLAVRIDFERRAELLATAPDIYYLTDHYVNYPVVLVRLSRIDLDALRGLLAMAWRFVSAKTRGGKRRALNSGREGS
jgi:hypothetical protein